MTSPYAADPRIIKGFMFSFSTTSSSELAKKLYVVVVIIDVSVPEYMLSTKKRAASHEPNMRRKTPEWNLTFPASIYRHRKNFLA